MTNEKKVFPLTLLGLSLLLSSCSGSIFSKSGPSAPPSTEAPASAPNDKPLAPNPEDNGASEIVDPSAPSLENSASSAQAGSYIELIKLIAPNYNPITESTSLKIVISKGVSDKGGNISHSVSFYLDNSNSPVQTITMIQIRDDQDANTRSLILNSDTQAHDTITETALGLSLRLKSMNNSYALEKGVLIQYIKHSPDKVFKLDSTRQINLVAQ